MPVGGSVGLSVEGSSVDVLYGLPEGFISVDANGCWKESASKKVVNESSGDISYASLIYVFSNGSR